MILVAAYLIVLAAVLAVFISPGVLAHRAGPAPADSPTEGSPTMTDLWLWQAYADDSADHRNPADIDVAIVICNCRHDGEMLRLEAGRDLSSLWERS